MPQGVIQGTVPYLGTFLTDLVMLDTAMKDYLYVSEPGLVVGRTEPLMTPELWLSGELGGCPLGDFPEF